MKAEHELSRVRRLQALGVVPLHLRVASPRTDVVVIEASTTPDVDSGRPVLQFWFSPTTNDAQAESDGQLVKHLVRALGLRPEQVAMGGDPAAAAITLAFGPGAPATAVRLPALDALRDALGKRAAWPTLRALRRRLRETQG